MRIESNGSSSAFRTVTISGGMPSPQSSLRMTPCSPSRSVWKMDQNDTVRIKRKKGNAHVYLYFQVLIVMYGIHFVLMFHISFKFIWEMLSFIKIKIGISQLVALCISFLLYFFIWFFSCPCQILYYYNHTPSLRGIVFIWLTRFWQSYHCCVQLSAGRWFRDTFEVFLRGAPLSCSMCWNTQRSPSTVTLCLSTVTSAPWWPRTANLCSHRYC